MNPVLQRNLFIVKEHLGIFKAANNYDIHDPETGTILLTCREERLGFLTKILRFTDYKRMTPFEIEVKSPDGTVAARVKRGLSFFLSKVEVLDNARNVIGGFQQKLFSIGGSFNVVDAGGRLVCSLAGKWTGWEFNFTSPEGREMALVTKKWDGLGKEFFTSADNYVLRISEEVQAGDPVRVLILAAVLTIDMVLKE